MTTLGEHATASAQSDAAASPASGVTAPCVYGGHDVDLPVNPFQALRVTFGMLLGEDDFRVLMGNPRGKQMLHSSWLHGSGVVWGLEVARDGDQLVVGPGLAVSGLGEELHLDVRCCLPLQEWAEKWQERYPPTKEEAAAGRREITGWVVAEFSGCLDRPMPALADPCDVTRKHDDFSRVVESVAIVVRPDRPRRPHPYRRVRMLLGLEQITADEAGSDVSDAIRAVTAARSADRAAELLGRFRVLAAHDATEWRPLTEEQELPPGLFPVTGPEAGVVLAKLTAEITERNGCVGFGEVVPDPDVRSVLLPTSTIQELTAGLAPGLLGAQSGNDADGPRLKTGTVHWTRGNSRVSFCVTRPIAEGSQESGIRVTSLSPDGRGWAPSHIDSVTLHDDGERVVVDLDNAPAYRWARVLIQGTGPTPLFGRDPWVPFAGIEGGPSGTATDGHDAVHTTDLSASEESRVDS
jgi:hypothetical protein